MRKKTSSKDCMVTEKTPDTTTKRVAKPEFVKDVETQVKNLSKSMKSKDFSDWDVVGDAEWCAITYTNNTVFNVKHTLAGKKHTFTLFMTRDGYDITIDIDEIAIQKKTNKYVVAISLVNNGIIMCDIRE